MSDDRKKSLSHWAGLGATMVAAAIGYGELKSKVASNSESLKANWSADSTFRETTAATDRAFREQVISNLAEVKAQLALLLQDRAMHRVP